MKLKTLVSLLAAAFAAPAVMAASDVVISQVYGGGGNNGATLKNDFIELFNRGASPVSLNGWSVQYASAGGTSFQATALPNVTLQPGQYFLVQQAAGTGGTVNLPTPDKIGTLAMGGTAGKVVLASIASPVASATAASVLDLVAYGSGATPFEGAGPTPASSSTNAVFRAQGGCTDSDQNQSDFSAAVAAPRNTASTFNVCGGVTPPPLDKPIVPVCPDASVTAGTGGRFSVTASDADSIVNAATISGNWPAAFTLGAFTAATADGGVATQEIEVASSVAGGSYSLNLSWANNEAQTASCTIKVSAAGFTPVYGIQGNGDKSPMEGATVSTGGIVTYLAPNGFYLQDRLGDGNAATSDGIFVFTTTAPTVSVGQEVKLSGKVAEFTSGKSTITQLTTISGLTTLSSGHAITPTVVDLASLAPGALEAYEGMLVTLAGPVMVQQNYFLGRYGQLTLAAGGRLLNPTNIMRPGPDAQALAQANLARAIILDDNNSAQNPAVVPFMGEDLTVRAGDTIAALTGVVDYGPATSNTTTGAFMYRLQPVGKPVFERTNPRSYSAPAVGGNISIASANVLNYFTTFVNGQTASGQTGQGCTLGGASSASNCRGANNAAEFTRQRDKIIASLSTLNADVVGLMEIQNNGNVALDNLVQGLNAVMGAGTYAATPLPADTGDDAIRVAMIYKPAKLKLVGAALSDTHSVNNRPTYAQGFQAANGERFAVAVNHLKSKSCSGASGANADQGDLQGCYNAQRVQQATQLRNFLPQVQAAAGTQDVILLGDFNAYAQEDPVVELTSGGAIVDLVGEFDPEHYSYVFDGFAGRLDHGFGTASIAPKVSFATSWHINADEPTVIDYNTEFNPAGYYAPHAFKSSDHDPMLLGLNLYKKLKGSAGRDAIVGSAGDDIIEGGAGADTLTGGAGRDQFVYTSMIDAGDSISDFTPADDLLDLGQLMRALGIASANPLASGHVVCTNATGAAVIGINAAGNGALTRSRPLVQLKGVSCDKLTTANYKF